MNKFLFTLTLFAVSSTQADQIKEIINNSDQNAYLIEYTPEGYILGRQGVAVTDSLEQAIMQKEEPSYKATAAYVITRKAKTKKPFSLNQDNQHRVLATKNGTKLLPGLLSNATITIDEQGNIKTTNE
ncbi:hypothetical protein H0X48_00145 [Candidatus Dependentiae bacterium]|nr:hypothetical protein [Candidatus Dependentiae bacterium]